MAYAKGVPMGAALPTTVGEAPTFLVSAVRDPDGANLDRAQIVKGWLDAEGRVQERVYDVAWSGDRTLGADGRLPAVGNTVDAATATWRNTIGAAQLTASWRDPDFDPELPAFYYLRALEIPTPRWTAYDAKYFGIELPDGPQPLLQVCTALLAAEVNIVQAYPLMTPPGGRPAVALMVDNMEMAIDTLATKDFHVITEHELSDD